MSATADLIAEAVRTAFAAGYGSAPRTISQDIDVIRVHKIDPKQLEKLVDWDHAAPTASAIKVFVKAMEEKVIDGNRSRRTFLYPIRVAMVAKVKSLTNENIDPLKALSQELRDWFYTSDRKLPGRTESVCEDVEIVMDADERGLSTARLFLSEFVIQFTGLR